MEIFPLPLTVPLTVPVIPLSTETIEDVEVDKVTPLLPKVSVPPSEIVPPPKVIVAVSLIKFAAVVRNVPPVRLKAPEDKADEVERVPPVTVVVPE